MTDYTELVEKLVQGVTTLELKLALEKAEATGYSKGYIAAVQTTRKHNHICRRNR